jgi:hypothetical protein
MLILGWLSDVDVSNVTDVSGVRAISIFRIDPEDEGTCTFKAIATLSTSERRHHLRNQLT